MKQQSPPSSEDLSALEEYYRRQLLEYKKHAKLPEQSAKASALPKQEKASEPAERSMQPKPPVIQAEAPAPKAEHTEALRNSEQAQKASLPTPRKREEAYPLSNGVSQQGRSSPALPTPGAEGSGVLPRVSPVLRAAAMVPPQRSEPFGRQNVASPSEEQQNAFGWIKVNATTASQAVPVKGAVVLIEKVENNRRVLVDQMTTDGSGNTPLSKPLATVPASESLTPNAISAPYTIYEVRVSADDFSPYRAPNVLVFAGETSLIDADMIPLRETMDFS